MIKESCLIMRYFVCVCLQGPFYEKLKSRFKEGECGHQRFDDVHHGFAAARGNLDDELNRTRVDETLKLVNEFFSRNLAD
jgi:hypothetical protein